MGREPGRIARWRAANINRADHVNSTGRLTVATRTVLVLLGAASIAVASVAMFRHDGDVVPTALVLVGAVLAVLGGLGRQVDSVNLKEGGLTYSLWRDEVLEKTTPEEVLEAATSAPPPVQRKFEDDAAVRTVTAHAYDEAVRAVLVARYGDEVEVPIIRDDVEDVRHIFQPGFIVRRGDKAVAVECSYGRRMAPLYSILNSAVMAREGVTGLVYVSPGARRSPMSNAMLLAERVGIVLEFAFWDGRDSWEARNIINTVDRLLVR
ncbi:hypothetical protein VSR01_16175 [Actinacidiphila sp. DG2A-62]|uniref:hypothetical protein n=1 Tax=Actinacidiphila sp. DG2A-62 TaxID=3108821 RepID=UPI002DBEE2F0|nr:hypothetical protein [Actinacidiphila sp. DG2A-62]MEC3994982.1 hypothetical protein [Actinacidiphila sp. DG2A-62]